MKSVACAGIDAGREPVDHHVPDVLLDLTGLVVMRRQRVPVGDEEQALVLVLQLHPVLQHAVVMPEMQRAGRAHAGQDSIGQHDRGGGNGTLSTCAKPDQVRDGHAESARDQPQGADR